MLLISLAIIITAMAVPTVHELLWIAGPTVQLRGAFLVMFINLFAYLMFPLALAIESYGIAVLYGFYFVVRVLDKIRK